MTTPLFTHRKQAGQALGAALVGHARQPDVRVLALPRGGAPVAFEVAEALRVPLDVFIVRKLGVPGQPEYAMGAIASGGMRVLNDELTRQLGISEDAIEQVARAERQELQRREQLYRANQAPLVVRGRTVLIIDDGLATGSTMLAAVRALRTQHPGRIVVAVPVGAQDGCEAVRREADELVCLYTPDPFVAVGLWYADFAQTTDEEVQALLVSARSDAAAGQGGSALP